MTLNTSVAIGKPTNVREVYDFCRKLLDTPDHIEAKTGSDCYKSGCKWIANPGGIGLPARLWINYGADGPMIEQPDPDEDEDDDRARLAKDPTRNGWAAIEVTFDTGYGYRGKNGESCSDLHARLVTALGQWLDRKGLPWKWQNEYTGEWHDRFDQLEKFGNAHLDTGAEMWFECMVKPAIEGLASETGA